MCSRDGPRSVLVGLSVPWDPGMDGKCCVSEERVRAAGLLGKLKLAPCTAVRLQVCLWLATHPPELSLFQLSKSSRSVSLSSRPYRWCSAIQTGERSAHLRKVLFPSLSLLRLLDKVYNSYLVSAEPLSEVIQEV